MSNNYIPLLECKPRTIYRLNSRNLSFGVFTPENNEFIGIREKFGQEYLFAENHYDTGAPYGTVKPKEVIGEVPEDIEIGEFLGMMDSKTKRFLFWDKTPDESGQDRDYIGGRKWQRVKGWFYKDTGEPVPYPRNPIMAVDNEKLFEFLKSVKFSPVEDDEEEG